MSLVHNERLKLTANWLNTLAAGTIVTGVVAPVVAAIYGVQGPSQTGAGLLTILGAAWVAVGTALHVTARWLLMGLMTWFEAYAFFGGPLIVLLIGLGMAYLAARDARKNGPDHRVPGE